MKMKIIAHIHTDFPAKFAIPRQSGLANELTGKIVFEPEYRSPEALRGIEGFSHLWLLWEFSEAVRDGWSPTVRPPKLGGNTHMGVFATRSPFRPNPIGLSCVEFAGVESDGANGLVIYVRGADLMNGTPIYDIKPYLPYTDCRPEAKGSFAQELSSLRLKTVFPDELRQRLPKDKLAAVEEVLALDPRPGYHDDAGRVYGFSMAGYEIKFTVDGNVLTVADILPAIDLQSAADKT